MAKAGEFKIKLPDLQQWRSNGWCQAEAERKTRYNKCMISLAVKRNNFQLVDGTQFRVAQKYADFIEGKKKEPQPTKNNPMSKAWV